MSNFLNQETSTIPISDSINILSDEGEAEEEEEEEEEEAEQDHKIPLIDSSNGLNQNSVPLSIAKIKIFKPRRRSRQTCVKKLLFFISTGLFLAAVYLFASKIIFSKSAKYLNRSTCDQFTSSFVWNKTFPKLKSESALRLVDVNNDSVLDIIMTFGTDVDAMYYKPSLMCQVYFNQSEFDESGCGGGVMAIDGRDGSNLWIKYFLHELFGANCNLDITGDQINDCIVVGRMASLFALNGASGDVIWNVASYGDVVSDLLNFYTPVFIPRDLDADGVPEIVVMHGGNSFKNGKENTILPARLLVISSKKGSILSWGIVNDESESYSPPQLITRPDGTLVILYSTGSETLPGALFAISFDDLLQGKMKNSRLIYSDCCKGVLNAPILVDINNDDVSDIVISLFNSTVVAFDGQTFDVLWKRQFSGSESYTTPSVGYFNNDSIPDFAVIYQFGPGFPIYYWTELFILDGKNASILLQEPVRMSSGTQSSPLTISTLAQNDGFIFWYSSCHFNQKIDNQSEIIKKDVLQDKTVSFCKFKPNSTEFSQLRIITPSSMSVIYDSKLSDRSKQTINYTAVRQKWLKNLGVNDYNNLLETSGTDQMTSEPIFKDYQAKPTNDNQYSQYDQIASAISYDNKPSYRSFPRKLRRRRHIGIHDNYGVQKVGSTGTLAPSLSKNSKTIDLIFAISTTPKKALDKKFADCMEQYLTPEKEKELRFGNENSFGHLLNDHDAYKQAVAEMCQVQDRNNPFGWNQNQELVEVGSVTVQRVTLSCLSDFGDKNFVEIKEYNNQMWPSYLGLNGDAVANFIERN